MTKKFYYHMWVRFFICIIALIEKMYSSDIEHTIINPTPKIVADLSFQIYSSEEKEFFYKFAEGDTLVFNAWVIKGNDISELTITKWPGTPVYSAVAIKGVENKKIFVEKEAIYSFKFKNTSLWSDKYYRFTLSRIPTKEEFITYDPTVEWDTLYDTTYVTVSESTLAHVDTLPEEVVNTQLKIGAGDRTYIKVSLPKNTIYWVYWVGVGQEAVNGLQEMASQLPEAAQVLGIADPVTAFAMGLLPKLFTLSKGLDITYYFLYDYDDVVKFMGGGEFKTFKWGERIITDYAKMEKTFQREFYMGLSNSYSIFTPKLVTVKIVAVKTIPKYNIREVQKPEVHKRVIPKINK